MYKENYINSLRAEIVEMVSNYLTPPALRYGYSEVPLETNIKWRPLVLVIGNYSSGKSTLINEFLEAEIQTTGQAPTDDSFTILTYEEPEEEADNDEIHVTEVRDGKYLLNDPEYPFEMLKKFGERFASHFCLKKVNAPFLKNISIIDTPGMLDSISERDRGYDYQEVVGELAGLSDLVLVLFDPHKAGTVREAHISLRDTLPTKTFEDRVLYVLNRIDECSSLVDLIRVYGTLCWNLSQITGHKDIPMIHLTYSPHATPGLRYGSNRDTSYLSYLDNQREELKSAIQQAPRYRLDHMASFVETHSQRIAHMLEGLISYKKRLGKFRTARAITGLFFSLVLGGAAVVAQLTTGVVPALDLNLTLAAGGLVALVAFFFWISFAQKYLVNKFHKNQMEKLDDLTPLKSQTRGDTWRAVRDTVKNYLESKQGNFSLNELKLAIAEVRMVSEMGCREIREALNELTGMKDHRYRKVETQEPEEYGEEESVVEMPASRAEEG